MIRDRFDCEICGETRRWRDALHALGDSDALKFRERLKFNDFRIVDESKDSKALRNLLAFYQRSSENIPMAYEDQRRRYISDFDEVWKDVTVRLSETEIASEEKIGAKWPYRF